MEIAIKEFDRIRNIKILDIQQCSFCHRLNILNLGWKPFGKFYCRLHEAEYLVCWELCYKVCRNIWGCQLFKEVPPIELAVPLVKPINFMINALVIYVVENSKEPVRKEQLRIGIIRSFEE